MLLHSERERHLINESVTVGDREGESAGLTTQAFYFRAIIILKIITITARQVLSVHCGGGAAIHRFGNIKLLENILILRFGGGDAYDYIRARRQGGIGTHIVGSGLETNFGKYSLILFAKRTKRSL